MCICSGLYSPREHFHFNISPPVFFWTLWWCPSYRLSDLVVCATLFSFAFDVVNFDVVNGGLNTLSFWALLFWGAGFLILLCHLCVSILVLQAAAFTMLFIAAKKESVHPSCISDTLWRNLKVCCGKGVPSLLRSYTMLGINFRGMTITCWVFRGCFWPLLWWPNVTSS